MILDTYLNMAQARFFNSHKNPMRLVSTIVIHSLLRVQLIQRQGSQVDLGLTH